MAQKERTYCKRKGRENEEIVRNSNGKNAKIQKAGLNHFNKKSSAKAKGKLLKTSVTYYPKVILFPL